MYTDSSLLWLVPCYAFKLILGHIKEIILPELYEVIYLRDRSPTALCYESSNPLSLDTLG